MAFRFTFAAGLVFSLTTIASAGCGSSSAGAEAADASPEAATVIADAQNDAPLACAQAYDCAPLFFAQPPNGPSAACCVRNHCLLERYDDDCTDANAQIIQASNYDQTCAVDTDCVSVAEGNFCFPGGGNCPNATINKGAMTQYQADVAKTRAVSCFGAPTSCGSGDGPCCVAGKCQIFGQCAGRDVDASADTGVLEAAADAGSHAATDAGTADAGGE